MSMKREHSTEHKPPKIIAGKHCKAQAVKSGKGKTVTVIGAANAVGQSVPSFFVFPGKGYLIRYLPMVHLVLLGMFLNPDGQTH